MFSIRLSTLFKIILGLVFSCFSCLANANDVSQIKSRLNYLEKDLQMMQRQLYNKAVNDSGSDGSGTSRMVDKRYDNPNIDADLSKLNDQLQYLNNRVEEVETHLGKVSSRLETIEHQFLRAKNDAYTEEKHAAKDKENLDIDSATEPHDLDALSSEPTPTIAKGKEGYRSEGEQDPNNTYEEALSLIKIMKFAEAQHKLQDFVNNYPESPLISNAYYWLGETYYSQSRFDKSSIYFLRGYKKSPTGPKAAPNLFKLALSLGKLKKPKEACATFTTLRSSFPNVSSSMQRKIKDELAKMSCK
jgi:tol-pal system protein YbgF